ncbi:hypothetical protein HAX54_039843 [Datura stramonium]|uniref:Uncharacterized protein n=1 Tax=Datura stramonium TaxID=4076 RepID=A0ABS8SJS7_DATST|nr:hypothetical protein [Datura stramonium]
MAAWTAAARQASALSRLSASKSVNKTSQGALLIQRRGLAGGGPSWSSKGELLAGSNEPIKMERRAFCDRLYWLGFGLHGGYKLFTGGKKEKKDEK